MSIEKSFNKTIKQVYDIFVERLSNEIKKRLPLTEKLADDINTHINSKEYYSISYTKHCLYYSCCNSMDYINYKKSDYLPIIHNLINNINSYDDVIFLLNSYLDTKLINYKRKLSLTVLPYIQNNIIYTVLNNLDIDYEEILKDTELLNKIINFNVSANNPLIAKFSLKYYILKSLINNGCTNKKLLMKFYNDYKNNYTTYLYKSNHDMIFIDKKEICRMMNILFVDSKDISICELIDAYTSSLADIRIKKTKYIKLVNMLKLNKEQKLSFRLQLNLDIVN